MSDRKEFEDWFFSPSNSMSVSDIDVAWEAWQVSAQRTQAEVTDEQKDFDDWWDKEKPNTTDAYSLSWYSWQARAALALQKNNFSHERAPVTDEFEKCAMIAWTHFMDTCRKKRVSPADWGDWCAANAIRNSHHGVKQKEQA